MADRALVTYASRTGSTAGVAAAIEETLAAEGWIPDVIPIKEVACGTAYQAMIIGSAVYRGQVLPETLKFIQDHHADLSERRCAVFVVCMTLALHNASAYRDQVSNFLAPVREYVSPVKEEYFAGALDLNKIPSFADRLKFKLSIQLGVWSEGDHRDWDAIRKWARAVSPLLH